MSRLPAPSLLRLLLIVVAGLLIGFVAASGFHALHAARPAGTQPTSRPVASQPTSAPSVDLAKQAARAAAALRKRLDGSFNIVVAPPFVVAGDMPESRLRRYLARSIVRPAEAMWASYFKARPNRAITVLLLSTGDSYRKWAKRLFDDTHVSYFGYYREADRTLVMNIDTGAGTLVHELTHALIRYDWPGVPTWFDEGLASLHEQCTVGESSIRGLPNWRLGSLQRAIRADRLRPLSDLVASDDFYGPSRGINYAQARYFCLYLQHRGLLKRFYRDYKAACAAGKPAAKPVIEVLCREPIAEVDRRCRDWVLTLTWPATSRPVTRPSSLPSTAAGTSTRPAGP